MIPTEPERRDSTPRERFARAVDEARAAAPTEQTDVQPEFDTELAIVERLRRTPTPGPDAATRQRIYERVRREFDGRPAPLPAPLPAGSRRPRNRTDPSRPERPGGIRRRLAVSATAVLCLFAVLGGLSLLLARDALPGDTLYDVRRMTEQASVQMTFDPAGRANRQLDFATERLRDLSALHSAGADAADYRIALDDFDADAAGGAQLLNSLGVSSSARSFTDLRDWIGHAQEQINTLSAALPPELRNRLRTSATLLEQIDDRITVLRSRLRCASVTNGSTDRLGPLPARSRDCPPPDARADGPRVSDDPDPADRTSVDGRNPPPTEKKNKPSRNNDNDNDKPQHPNTPQRPPNDQGPNLVPQLPKPVQRPVSPPTTHRPPESTSHKPLITLPPVLGLPGISIG